MSTVFRFLYQSLKYLLILNVFKGSSRPQLGSFHETATHLVISQALGTRIPTEVHNDLSRLITASLQAQQLHGYGSESKSLTLTSQKTHYHTCQNHIRGEPRSHCYAYQAFKLSPPIAVSKEMRSTPTYTHTHTKRFWGISVLSNLKGKSKVKINKLPSVNSFISGDNCNSILFVCLVGFSTTRLYRGRVSRQSFWQFYVLPHMRQNWETMTSVSVGHIILTPTQPVGSERPQRDPGPPHQESCALPTAIATQIKRKFYKL